MSSFICTLRNFFLYTNIYNNICCKGMNIWEWLSRAHVKFIRWEKDERTKIWDKTKLCRNEDPAFCYSAGFFVRTQHGSVANISWHFVAKQLWFANFAGQLRVLLGRQSFSFKQQRFTAVRLEMGKNLQNEKNPCKAHAIIGRHKWKPICWCIRCFCCLCISF